MKCELCFRGCTLSEGQTGFCKARVGKDGRVVSLYPDGLCALAIDPVEKKPLYHFLPGTRTLSLAKPGCSFDCDFCQNADIARDFSSIRVRRMEPREVVDAALESGCPSISFTYTEPIVWLDYVEETAVLAKERGLKTIMVSNGAFSESSLERILPLIDAYNIDLKGDGDFYRRYCHAEKAPVSHAIERILAYGSHLEVTSLLIEGIHTEEMVSALATELGSQGLSVWHLSRFFPRRRMEERMPTSEAFLDRMFTIARKSTIPHIYRGNSRSHDETFCPDCGSLAPGGLCPACGRKIYGLWA